MTAYAIVRFRAKVGSEDEVIRRFQMIDRPMAGFRKGVLVRTGPREFCAVGEWRRFEDIVAARPEMGRNLSVFRELLEERPEGGHTDAASGEVVVEMGLASAEGVVDGLSQIGKYVVLLDGLGRVLHLPPALQGQPDGVLLVQNRRLITRDPAGGAELAAAIGRATRSMPALTPGLSIVPLPRAERPPLIIRVVPLTSAAENVFAARVAVVVTDPEELDLSNIAAISDALDLTPAEARLAWRIGNGEALKTVAVAEKITLETARTRLKSVFSKTGVHRQSQLAALMAALRH